MQVLLLSRLGGLCATNRPLRVQTTRFFEYFKPNENLFAFKHVILYLFHKAACLSLWRVATTVHKIVPLYVWTSLRKKVAFSTSCCQIMRYFLT